MVLPSVILWLHHWWHSFCGQCDGPLFLSIIDDAVVGSFPNAGHSVAAPMPLLPVPRVRACALPPRPTPSSRRFAHMARLTGIRASFPCVVRGARTGCRGSDGSESTTGPSGAWRVGVCPFNNYAEVSARLPPCRTRSPVHHPETPTRILPVGPPPALHRVFPLRPHPSDPQSPGRRPQVGN